MMHGPINLSKHYVSRVSGTRPELPVKVIPEKNHVNFVLYVTHDNGETQLFTRKCENEKFAGTYLRLSLRSKKILYPKV